ncbi:MBL fold metallo-hydrolase [Magnetococcus marinus]|uniref:MBL fold metallo-hydrolase n=1 Tax=Magnetococcus marinus TaxID=1124597 RepID=UPI001D114C37|nr:MBL fold metallo-hydrolase [Magnetococcus marinus]
MRAYPPVQVADGVYVMHGPLGVPSVANQGFMNNPAFIITQTGVVVIDPGSSVQAGRMVVEQIRTVTEKPVTHVLNTHVHGDHWLGNHGIVEGYAGVQILAHPAMIEEALGSQAERWLEYMVKATEGFTQGTQAVIPTVPVGDDTVLTLGGVRMEILAPPKAHSGTDMMIYLPSQRLLFTGDNVTSERFGRLDDGTFKGGIAACDRALERPVEVVVPGHGATGGVGLIAVYRTYLRTLYDTVKVLYDEGTLDTPHAMKPRVVEALSVYHDWVDFDEMVGRHISAAFQQVEASEF